MRIVIIKPSKYLPSGAVERFRRGFMPNSTLPHLRSMVPNSSTGASQEIHTVDEYVHTDISYLELLKNPDNQRTLVVLAGVQSHQFHRALDLAAMAHHGGCMVIIGGPHVMTCDTSSLHGRGVSFAQCEAELVWDEILADAKSGELKPLYGQGLRWQAKLESPTLVPPNRSEFKRYIVPMLGVYPARGCPFQCNFCSVIKIAGNKIRSQSVDVTLASLRAAKSAGITTIMFTSDNFNKYPQAKELLEAMIREKLHLKFFVQCDTQVSKQTELVELLAKAGCYQMFVGVESFDRETLIAAHKKQNRPQVYSDIVEVCRNHGISSHFSNILGFPQDTEQSIRQHLTLLQDMGPTWASFYILCPIPGTEQYDSFMAEGLITETNLDRFDTSCLTWKHPNLSPDTLTKLLYECYRKFGSVARALKNLSSTRKDSFKSYINDKISGVAMALFVRYCAWRETHPMSGGIGRLTRDYARDYLHLRTKMYGFEYSPLPRSLSVENAEKSTTNKTSIEVNKSVFTSQLAP